MPVNLQPEALRLAALCGNEILETVRRDVLMNEVEAELRRLHAENEQLRQALQNLITVTQHLNVCPGTPEKPNE